MYTQLTDFTDSAVAPALSPDGRMLAFIRGGEGFLTSDQIYVKMLPDGEAKRVTDDDRPKYGLAFSPDGSEIAYTVLDEFRVFHVRGISVGRRASAYAEKRRRTSVAGSAAAALFRDSLAEFIWEW